MKSSQFAKQQGISYRTALVGSELEQSRASRSRKWGSEIAYGANESRPKLLGLLKETSITLLVVEHRDRLTRFGFHFLETLLQTKAAQDRGGECWQSTRKRT